MVSPAALPDWLRTEYPFTPRRLRLRDGAEMSLLDEGPRRDEAVLLVHGNPTWSFHFRHLVRALAPRWRCIAPDHVGMGLSDKPAERPCTLARRIADLTELVDALALRRVHLVVHDWGGAIGLGWAGRNPGCVGRVTILNTAAFRSPRIPTRIALCRTPWLGALLVRGLNGFALPATWMTTHRRTLSPVERRGYLWPYRTWNDRRAVHAFVRDIPLGPGDASWQTLAEVEESLPRLRTHAVQMLWGGRDFCFDDTFLARWRAVFPAGRVHRYADAGHYVLEDARREVISRIGAFLGE